MRDNKVDIIIIRGAPGSGKSQTAKNLSKHYPKGVKMEVDVLRQMVISVDWKNQDEHINLLTLSTRLVYDFLNLGFSPVIVVDTFSGDKIEKYLEHLYELKQELSIKIFGLYVTEEELRRRLEFRTSDEFRDFPICKKLNDDLLKKKYANECQIDTTGLLPNQTSDFIYNQINNCH